MPKISIGEPHADDLSKFKFIEKDAIKIYFSSGLNIENGSAGIKIKLRKLLFIKWLEIED